jgi:AcrR family transcriptional regulator
MTAAERRQALIEAAIAVFADGSYRGVTTAEIARAAGVSEPILYRHFSSKCELYLAAVGHQWSLVRGEWEQLEAEATDPAEWLSRMAKAKASLTSSKFRLAELWVQALSEAGEEPQLRKYLRSHLREVHGYLVAAIGRAQAAGAINPDRDAEAEAWIFLAGGVLSTISRRIGLLDEDDFARIRASRIEWLTMGEPHGSPMSPLLHRKVQRES